LRTGAVWSEEIHKAYDPYLRYCREKLRAGLADGPLGPILVAYFERGKMLRALLVFLGASAVGGDPATVYAVAEAVELLHAAGLVHDDIIDDAAERRGRAALHRQVGSHTALVLGDYLLVRSFAVLARVAAVHPPERVLEAVSVLSHCAQECCSGQIEELMARSHLGEEEAYISMVRQKTGSQFAAAAVLGALIPGGTRSEIESLRVYGLNVGTAFQIQDDMLDLIGEREILGKPIGQSLRQERPGLASIYVERFASASTRLKFWRMKRLGCCPDELIGLLERDGVVTQIRKTQEHYVLTAQSALEGLHASQAVKALREIAVYAVARQM
jgi:geranylgeranyl pyrophosphate synthase